MFTVISSCLPLFSVVCSYSQLFAILPALCSYLQLLSLVFRFTHITYTEPAAIEGSEIKEISGYCSDKKRRTDLEAKCSLLPFICHLLIAWIQSCPQSCPQRDNVGWETTPVSVYIEYPSHHIRIDRLISGIIYLLTRYIQVTMVIMAEMFPVGCSVLKRFTSYLILLYGFQAGCDVN